METLSVQQIGRKIGTTTNKEGIIKEGEDKIEHEEEKMLTAFVRALKLFWNSKRLRWLSAIFILSLIWMTFIYGYGPQVIPSSILIPLTVVTGGIWPFFFMLTAVFALLRLERLVASQRSYLRSFLILLPWLLVSGLLLVYIWSQFVAAFLILIFGVAFLGWISFQAFFSARTSLHYADDIYMKSHPLLIKIIAVFTNFICNGAIIWSYYYTVYILNPSQILNQPRELPMIVGLLFALSFNFINLLFMVRHRHTTMLDNLAMFGFFISIYSAYFIYEAGKPVDLGISWVSISISVFFVIYTMGAVGDTLAEKSHVRPHWKLSAESSVTLTFFLASGYYFANTFLSVLFSDPTLAATIGVTIKLLIFPFVAIVTEVHHMQKHIGGPPEQASAPVQIQSPASTSEVSPSTT
jgi:hypothetical protein